MLLVTISYEHVVGLKELYQRRFLYQFEEDQQAPHLGMTRQIAASSPQIPTVMDSQGDLAPIARGPRGNLEALICLTCVSSLRAITCVRNPY
jgi:hypothetical protein